MTEVYVQFADDAEKVVVSYFSTHQDPAVWQNQATLPSDDPRYETYYSSYNGVSTIQACLVTPGT